MCKIMVNVSLALLTVTAPAALAQDRLMPINYLASAAATSVSPKADKKMLDEELRDFAETLKRLHHASGELHAEVNRRETIVVGPDVLDTVIMDPWASYQPGMYPGALQSGFQNTRPGPLLPPRQRYIDLSVSQLQQLVPLLDTELHNIMRDTQSALPTDDSIKAQLMVANDARTRLDATYQKLVALTKAPPYDNKSISHATEDVRDEISTLNDIRHRVLKLVDRDI